MQNIDHPRKKEFFRRAFLRFILGNNVCAPTDEYDYVTDITNLIGDLDSIKSVHLLDLLRTLSISGRINEVEDKLHDEEIDAIHVKEEFDAQLDKEHPTPIDNFKFAVHIVTGGKKDDEQSFRNVQELKSSGINMKPSNSRNLKSVSFGTHCFGFRGHLKLPTLAVNESTVCKLLNLVAYEMCLDDPKKHRVTSYLDFMDLLIDTEQDAKDLRAAHILRNRLSTDAEVAQVFNMIGSTYFSKKPDYYVDVKNKIEEHYKRKCAVWMAQVYSDHFGNPWTIVALLAAAIVLILTFIQTWYAIYPS